MDKFFKNIIIFLILYFIVVVNSYSCQNPENINGNCKSITSNHKKFDYKEVIKNLPDSIKKEIAEYYQKINTEYNKLSDDAKEAVRKIAKRKNKFFLNKDRHAKKKDFSS